MDCPGLVGCLAELSTEELQPVAADSRDGQEQAGQRPEQGYNSQAITSCPLCVCVCAWIGIQ